METAPNGRSHSSGRWVPPQPFIISGCHRHYCWLQPNLKVPLLALVSSSWLYRKFWLEPDWVVWCLDSCLFCAAIGSQWPLSYPPDQSAAWTHGSIKTSLLVLHACTSSMLPRDSVLSFHISVNCFSDGIIIYLLPSTVSVSRLCQGPAPRWNIS